MNLEIKICGLTNAGDVRAALEAGADYLGFVLYARSPRAVTPAVLEEILATTGAAPRSVGVFVNTPADEVLDTVMRCGLAVAQIHGDEAASDFHGMPVPVWRAVSAANGAWTPPPATWPQANRYVVDAAVPGQYGGTGSTADWPLAAALAREVPVMLAGGLNPENIGNAVLRIRPLGVDVSSGVELRPGVKSHPALRAFITAARHAAAQLTVA